MLPELFTIELPEFIQSLLKVKVLTIYSYPLLICIGAFLAYNFLKKNNIPKELLSLKYILLIIVFAFIGGKLFLFFEKPYLYFKKPNLIIESLNSSGFVFYGSFIFIFIFLFYYLKRKKKNIFKVLDSLSIGFLIVHFFGRLGCFFAGCCFGKTTDSIFGVIFKTTEPFKVHPTQLYEAVLLLSIVTILLINKKKFDGQIFLIYIILYGFGRYILENYRGDTRGIVLNGAVSHSQFIALFFIIIASYKYISLNYILKSKKS